MPRPAAPQSLTAAGPGHLRARAAGTDAVEVGGTGALPSDRTETLHAGLRGESRHAPHSSQCRSGRAQRQPCWPRSQGHSQSPRRGRAGSGPSSHPHTAAPRAGSLPYGSSPTPPPTLSLRPVPPKFLPAHCSEAAKGSRPTAHWAGHPSRAILDTPFALGPGAKEATQPQQSLPAPTPGPCAAPRGLSARDREQGAGRGLASSGRGLSGTSAIHSLEMRKGGLLRLG